MGNTNCSEVMPEYLLNQNVFYESRWVIAIIASIFISLYLRYTMPNINSSLRDFIIPILLIFIVVFSIEFIVKATISHEEIVHAIKKCNSWQIDQSNTANVWLRDPESNKPIILPQKFMNNSKEYFPFDNKKACSVGYNPLDILDDDTNKVNNVDKAQQEKNKLEKEDLLQNIDMESTNTDNPDSNFNDQENFVDDRIIHSTNMPIGDLWGLSNRNEMPIVWNTNTGCLLGSDSCSPLCSGNNSNPCDLYTPIPGPQWQPQSASTVQERLVTGNYVPSLCNQGETVLRNAPKCKNLKNFNSSRKSETTECIAAQIS